MSQEIQIVNPSLPLQPAIGGSSGSSSQFLAPAGLPEQTPLRRVHQLLRGRYALAAVLALIGAAVGAAVGFKLPKPMYESAAILRVDPIIIEKDQGNSVLPFYQNFVADLMVELKTDKVIRRAMQSPEWKSLRPYAGEYPPAEQVAEFSRNLTVRPVPMTPEMIQILYDDTRPDSKQVAQVAVKSLLNAFRTEWTDPESNALETKISYHSDKIRDLNIAIAADQKAITDLQKLYGDESAMLNVHQQNLMDVQRHLNESKEMLQSAERDLERRRIGLNGFQPYTLEEICRVDPALLAKVNARNEQQTNYDYLVTKYGTNYPQAKEAMQLLQIRQRDVEESVKRFNDEFFIQERSDGGPGRPIPKDLTKLRAIVANYKAQFDAETDKIKEINEVHAKIQTHKDSIAQNQAMLAQESHELEGFLFEKQMGGHVIVVDDGTEPVQSGDRRPVFAALGLLGGAALPVGFLLLIGLANPRYRFSDEAHNEVNGLNLLGILPDLPDRLSDPEQASIAAHCVHQIRTMLQISGAPEERRVFAITSAAPGDGKTSLTLALGLSYAACGARTLLIDCDLVGAGLTSRMNVSAPSGVLEAIANRSLIEYVRTTDVADVSILPVGTAQTLHASTLSPAALRRLIDEARKQYDTILIDTGPILGSIEASLVCAAADVVVLTVARGQQRPLVEKAIQRLMGIGARLAGVVFNRAQSGDFDRSISGASSLRSAAAGSAHNGNGNGNTRYGTLGRAVHSHYARQSDLNEG
jgi:polysaccharide biosynthesis transport protein